MKISDAKKRILAIFESTVGDQSEDGVIPEDFMVRFIEKTIASCGDSCLYNEMDKQGLIDCHDSLKKTLSSYRSTTKNIATITNEEIPAIDTLFDAIGDDRLKVASSKLKTLQSHLQKEIETAGKAIEVFQDHVDTIKNFAKFDPVTKLMNAYTFADDILPIIRVGERINLDMGIMMLQVENYHEIIAEHSDVVFNKLLIYIAKALKNVIRHENRSYRYNHNTFFILFNRSSANGVEQSERRVINQITKNLIEYNKKPVTLALNISETYHQKGDTVDSMIKRLEENKRPVK